MNRAPIPPHARRHTTQLPRCPVIGITGGIGMGKSTLSQLLRAPGVCISSADALVHDLMRPGTPSHAEIAAAFPEAITPAGIIDRKQLGAIVFSDPARRRRLEAILHPRVVAREIAFAKAAMKKGARLVVIEIPLLFETGAQARLDAVITATAPAFLQVQRVLKRPSMTREKFTAILAAQWPDRARVRGADLAVPTGLGKAFSARCMKTWLESTPDE